MAKRRGTRRGSRKQRGGATPYYSFGSAVAPGAPYAAKVEVHDSPNVTRPGFLTSAGAGTGGLPGFTGGGRRKRSRGFNLFRFARNSTRRVTKMGRNLVRRGAKTLKRFIPKQRGGRYTVDVGGAVLGTNVFAPVNRIACEGSTPNPLNPGPHTPSTQPPIMGGGGKRSGMRKRKGTRKQKGGVWGVDSAAYYAPTAGYGNTPSTWVSSTGTPSMLQTPYAAGAMVPACLKTGGGRRKRSGMRRGACRSGRCGY
jgi:hypothetical protein